VFFDGKNPYKEGDLLVQTDLANTFDQIRHQGTDHFYRGSFAAKVGTWMKEHGGILTADDFANYEVKLREPVVTTYREYPVLRYPPPSCGGLRVAQSRSCFKTSPLARFPPDCPGRATQTPAVACSRKFPAGA